MGISVFPAAGGGVTQKVQTFTSTGTFTVPSNVSAISVFAVGAGAGGGCFINSGGVAPFGAGGGGGGGEVIEADIAVTPGAAYTITIGAGGAGGNSSNAGSGNDTTIGSLLTAKGGGGGAGWQNSPATLYPGTSRGTGGGGFGRNQDSIAWWSGCGGGAGGSAWQASNQRVSTGTSVGIDGIFATTSFGGAAVQAYSVNTHQAYSSGRGGNGYLIGAYNSPGYIDNVSNNVNLNTLQYAGVGIDGYGCGGPGAGYNNTRPVAFSQGVLSVGSTGGNANGNSGAANTGNGGGGGSGYSGSASGGSGGSGFVRITYWS